MFNREIERLLGRGIGLAVHSREELDSDERVVRDEILGDLPSPDRVLRTPTVIAMIGAVASGKSAVANMLANELGALVIENDAIRVSLRNRNVLKDRTRAIAEDAAVALLKNGDSVVLDSDFVQLIKRASLREKLADLNANLFFVRTHCTFDVLAGRVMRGVYPPHTFFGGAPCAWNDGTDDERGAIVKLREHWRRTPHHFRWSETGGGTWILREPPCPLLGDINTRYAQDVIDEVARCARVLKCT